MRVRKMGCLVLAAAVFAASPLFAGGSGDSEVKGAHAWVFKSQGNKFGDLMFQGFNEVVTRKGERAIYKFPAETTVTAQVQVLDELITQGVKSLSVSTNGDQGYDRVIQKAKEKKIPIISADSAFQPNLRTVHVNPTSQTGIGSSLIQAAVLINLKVPYPTDGNLEQATAQALASYTGPEMVFGVLSASVDTPVQNGWIDKMRVELQKPMYKGKVNPNLDLKYGNDMMAESTTQANAFIAENKVNVVISPTTIGMAAAGQALTASGSPIKLTGLGLPSEMAAFMPAQPGDDEFSKVCPYMMLWDVIDLGRVTGGAAVAAAAGTFDGKPGSKVELEAYGNYPARTFTAQNDPDGKEGTVLIVGDPYVFHKGNMKDWVNVL